MIDLKSSLFYYNIIKYLFKIYVFKTFLGEDQSCHRYFLDERLSEGSILRLNHVVVRINHALL